MLSIGRDLLIGGDGSDRRNGSLGRDWYFANLEDDLLTDLSRWDTLFGD